MATARILVVDDDPSLLELACCLLRSPDGGYDVLLSSSPRWAPDLVRSEPFIDLVISDVEMPEMSGLDLLREASQISPATAGLLISGHTKKDKLPSSVPFLEKTSIDELARTVETILARTRQVSAEIKASMEKTVELCGQAQRRGAELLQARCELRNSKRRATETLEESRGLRKLSDAKPSSED